MKTRGPGIPIVLTVLALVATAGLVSRTAPAAPVTPSVEKATARLAALDRDLDRLRERIENSRGIAPTIPSDIPEELGRARPRVREAISHLFGLRWDLVGPTLAAAHAIERKIADLEREVKAWSSTPVEPAPPVTSPTADGAITGIVTDQATGLPLANVTVVVKWSWPEKSATSDSTGRWIVTGLGTGTYYAYTSAPAGYANEVYENVHCVSHCYPPFGTTIAVTDGAVTSGIDFSLERFGSVSGTVTDVTSGLGVSQVLLRLHRATTYQQLETRTNADGSYSFPQVPPGTYFLSTHDSRYFGQLYDGKPCGGVCDVSTGTPIVVVASADTPNVDFALQLGGSVSGKVMSATTGAPIPGGSVRLYDAGGSFTYDYLDSSGSYRFEGLQSGMYYAKTETWSNYADQVYDGIVCEPTCDATTGTPIVVTVGQESLDVNFSLAEFGAFQGRVTDSVTGFPLDDTTIATYSSGGMLRDYAYVDSYGYYTAGGLLTGTYFAVANSATHLDELYENLLCQPSCAPTAGTPIAVTFGSTTNSIDFALDLGGGVSGSVTAAGSGLPVGSIQVEVYDSSGASVGYVHTSAQGGFMLGDLLPGVYFARALRSSNHLGQLYDGLPCDPSCTVTAGTPIQVVNGVATSGVNFSLTSLGSLSGIVTDAGTGLPLAGGIVSVYDATGAYVGYANSNSAGTYEMTGLLAGNYFAMVSAAGHVQQLYDGIQCLDPCTITAGTPVPVALSSETGGIDFAMTALGSISGTVTDAATGLPLEYRHIAVYDATGTGVGNSLSEGRGRYTVTGLRAGSYFVKAWLNTEYVDELYDNLDCGGSCDVTTGTPVVVTLGAVTAGIDFKLHKPYFADVGLDYWARRYIEGIFVGGVTSGCGTNPLRYCPSDLVSRWEMAVFLARSIAGSDAAVPASGTVPSVGPYDCVAGGVSLFPNDVPPTDGGCRHIHYVYSKGVTAGCAPGSFCPGGDTTRWQTAVFMAIALAGSDAAVPVSGTIPGGGDYNCVAGGSSLFPNDVPPTDGACRHVHYIYGQGITAGCADGSFCPSVTLSRDQMAVFLAKGFHFTSTGLSWRRRAAGTRACRLPAPAIRSPYTRFRPWMNRSLQPLRRT